MIAHDKHIKECQKFYRLGYKTAFQDMILTLKNIDADPVFLEKCINVITKRYESYPLINKESS